MTDDRSPGEVAAAAVTPAPGLAAGAAPVRPWPGEIVQLDQGQVFVRATPPDAEAEPVVFVHGLGGSALNWTDLMGQLRQSDPDDNRPALAGHALDLPGFGFSPPPADRDYSLDARVAAVAALIEKNANWPVHLVGNSLGGAISVRLAARRPDLARTLTLISPALPDLRPRLLPARLALVSVPGVGRWLLDRMLTMTPEARADASISELYADPARIAPQRRAEAIAEVMRRDGLEYAPEVLLASARALVREYTRPGPASLWHDAAKVAAPTLLIHGSHDRLVNPAMAGRAARTFRDCRVVVLPRIGHVAMMERPDLVAGEMRQFLAHVREYRAGRQTTLAPAAQPPPAATGRTSLRPASG